MENMIRSVYVHMQLVCTVWVAFLILSIWAGSDCREAEKLQLVEGYYCPKDENSIILGGTTECRHQCMQSGLHRQCNVITYDTTENTCLIQSHLCPVLLPNSTFAVELPVRDPDPVCIKWVPYADEVPDRTVQDASDRMTVVAGRYFADGWLVPGKFEITGKMFFGIRYNSPEAMAPSAMTEFLVVDMSCTTMWVAYNSLQNDPLPTGAIAAGHKSDGKSVYFIRIWVENAFFKEYSYGYYDPVSRSGYAHAGVDTQSSTVFDVLCII